MTRKEQLEKELADIKAKERQGALTEQQRWTETLKHPREIKLADGMYKLVFHENYGGGSHPHPDKVGMMLMAKNTLVRHGWNGEVLDVLSMNVSKTKSPQSVFEPIDKGRPSTVLCDRNGKAMFSFAVYEDKEVGIYLVSEVNAW